MQEWQLVGYYGEYEASGVKGISMWLGLRDGRCKDCFSSIFKTRRKRQVDFGHPAGDHQGSQSMWPRMVASEGRNGLVESPREWAI